MNQTEKQTLLDALDALKRTVTQFEHDHTPLQQRADGTTVRVDRWEVGIRRIVALLWGNRREFEIDEVVEAVRQLVPNPHAEGIDESTVVSMLAQTVQQPVGYWQGKFSDGGATLYAVPQESIFGRKYPNIPLYSAQTVNRAASTLESLRDAVMTAASTAVAAERRGKYPGAAAIADAVLNDMLHDTLQCESSYKPAVLITPRGSMGEEV